MKTDSNIFCKGYTWGWCAKRGDYRTKEAYESMKRLKDDGCDWIAICFYTVQEHYYSTKIYFDYELTPTDADIIYAIKMAKELGLKVCLKPVINPADGIWRARISFPNDRTEFWDKWFKSYTAFISHYAEIAQETQCELFCVGCEMVGSESQYSHWVSLIERVRTKYSGLVTYNMQHGCYDSCNWLDKLDIVGLSAYFPVSSNEKSNTLETQYINWQKYIAEIEQVHKKSGKPILFIEIGCQSVEGATRTPWAAAEASASEKEQADFYESAMRTFYHQDWFCGYFWWDWPAILYPESEAKTNKAFCAFGKEAEQIIKKWYTTISKQVK